MTEVGKPHAIKGAPASSSDVVPYAGKTREDVSGSSFVKPEAEPAGKDDFATSVAVARAYATSHSFFSAVFSS